MDNNSTNIEEYYNLVKEQYDIDLVHFRAICISPFRFVKEIMSSGVLKNIRLKYLGTFEVSSGRVKFTKTKLKENLDNGLISEKRYSEKMKTLNNYETQ